MARRYALALADAITTPDEQRAVQEELIAWEAIIESNPQLKQVLGNPTIPYEPKRTVLNELIGLTKVRPTTANFLNLLLKNQRLTELGEIIKKICDHRG